MSNPYDAPQGVPAPAALGSIDVMAAFSTGTAAVMRNALPWAGALIASMLAIGISLLMCLLPAFVVVPLMSWGLARFYLDAIDGDASLDTAFSGFSRAGDVFVPTFLAQLLLLVIVILATLPLSIAQWVVDQTADPMVQVVVDTVISLFNGLIQTFISLRLGFALYLIVERKLSALDAMSASWELTSGVRMVQLFGLLMVGSIATLFCMLPGIGVALVSLWPALSALRMPGLTEALIAGAGFLITLLGAIPPAILINAATVAAYRQLVPRA
jgi:membrane-anchored glycerophosphoryl diester phosphodiesterase (GDPDase)